VENSELLEQQHWRIIPKYFEKDKALERRFQKIIIEEPDTESAISILRGIKEKYETHHKVQIKDEAIIAAVNYQNVISQIVFYQIKLLI
jgi:ATP-dependent Clp protease ATP-binding subunit ClpA